MHNRRLKTMNHTTGAKSFARVRAQLAKTEGNIQTMIESGQEDSDELRTRVYIEMMDPEHHNRVRGYGHGVTPDMVSYASSSAYSSNSSRRSSRSSVAVLMTQNNELRRKDEVNAKWMADPEKDLLFFLFLIYLVSLMSDINTYVSFIEMLGNVGYKRQQLEYFIYLTQVMSIGKR
ncbi:uncharacterized protein LOC126606858 isoform X2 [Malus sylvestris]|uniref:uncharacterized protein LOC126606858 isoform X2 n=1 Tax=Malus sylvestris TaxID=3752 RepID=UPI0021AD2A5A|nr:uncharacterized protein LOC126606858 isoform X2 [Malus sylvestris]